MENPKKVTKKKAAKKKAAKKKVAKRKSAKSNPDLDPSYDKLERAIYRAMSQMDKKLGRVGSYSAQNIIDSPYFDYPRIAMARRRIEISMVSMRERGEVAQGTAEPVWFRIVKRKNPSKRKVTKKKATKKKNPWSARPQGQIRSKSDARRESSRRVRGRGVSDSEVKARADSFNSAVSRPEVQRVLKECRRSGTISPYLFIESLREASWMSTPGGYDNEYSYYAKQYPGWKHGDFKLFLSMIDIDKVDPDNRHPELRKAAKKNPKKKAAKKKVAKKNASSRSIMAFDSPPASEGGYESPKDYSARRRSFREMFPDMGIRGIVDGITASHNGFDGDKRKGDKFISQVKAYADASTDLPSVWPKLASYVLVGSRYSMLKAVRPAFHRSSLMRTKAEQSKVAGRYKDDIFESVILISDLYKKRASRSEFEKAAIKVRKFSLDAWNDMGGEDDSEAEHTSREGAGVAHGFFSVAVDAVNMGAALRRPPTLRERKAWGSQAYKRALSSYEESYRNARAMIMGASSAWYDHRSASKGRDLGALAMADYTKKFLELLRASGKKKNPVKRKAAKNKVAKKNPAGARYEVRTVPSSTKMDEVKRGGHGESLARLKRTWYYRQKAAGPWMRVGSWADAQALFSGGIARFGNPATKKTRRQGGPITGFDGLHAFDDKTGEACRATKKKAAKKSVRKKTPPYQLLINRCHKLWTEYCERPSKKRLEAIYVHLDKMKESTSQKVKTERSRCLRAANAEAKRLKYTRKK